MGEKCCSYQLWIFLSDASQQHRVLRLVTRKFHGGLKVLELKGYTHEVDEKWRNVGEAPEPL